VDLRFLASFPQRDIRSSINVRTRLLHSILPLIPFIFLSRLYPQLKASPRVPSIEGEKKRGREREREREKESEKEERKG
jgi:hypothetical protein